MSKNGPLCEPPHFKTGPGIDKREFHFFIFCCVAVLVLVLVLENSRFDYESGEEDEDDIWVETPLYTLPSED